MPEQDKELVTQDRLLSNLVIMGRVTATDYKENPGMVRVRIGADDEKSAEYYMPWLRRRGGNDWEWWAPEKDEQVLIVSPDGDLDRAVIVGSLPYAKKADYLTPAQKGQRWVLEEGGKEPGDDEKNKDESTGHVIHYQDKTAFSYDKKLHIFQASFLESKAIDLKVEAKKDEEKAVLKVNGVDIKIDAKTGKEKITVDVNEKTKLEMDAENKAITIESTGNITVKAKDITLTLGENGSVTLDCKKLTIDSKGEVAVKGSAIKLNC